MRERILYCVLDWGLGHATRSIPTIRALISAGCEVVIASDSFALAFLRAEFPSLHSHELPSYDVEYKSEHIIQNGIANSKRMRIAIKAEHDMIGEIVIKEKIDAIISDNRYGCYVPGIPSVLITHQLRFRTGNWFYDTIGRMMIRKLIRPFDSIWIPDTEERTLSGELSMSDDSRVRYIGWQSTLIRKDVDKQFAIAAILSGPEPMRSTLEAEIRTQFEMADAHCVLVRGAQGSDEERDEKGVTVYDVLDREGINQLMNSASIILCRSGYSSLMDLQTVQSKAILVPTPGQPEQIYLAERMKRYPQYIIQLQGEIDIQGAIDQLESVEVNPVQPASSMLIDKAVRELINPY